MSWEQGGTDDGQEGPSTEPAFDSSMETDNYQEQPQNEIEKQINEALQTPVDSEVGESMMKKMGWTGGGLGKSGEGIVEPIAPNASYVSEKRSRYYGANLSGAAIRRYKKLVKAKIPPQKAAVLCQMSYKELQEEAKKAKEGEDSEQINAAIENAFKEKPNPNPFNKPRFDKRNFNKRFDNKYSRSRFDNQYSFDRPFYESYGKFRTGYPPPDSHYGESIRNFDTRLDFSSGFDNYYDDRENPNFSPSNSPLDNWQSDNRRDDANSGRSFPDRDRKTHNDNLNVCIHNEKLMTKEQIEMLHRALNEAILNINEKGVGPKFKALVRKSGWVLVTCQDEMSKKWLFDEVPHLRPWPQARLHVREEKVKAELSKGTMVTAYIPQHETKSIEEALRLLRVQNEGLNTESWRVFNGKKFGSGLIIAFLIDDSSLSALRDMDFTATLGFTTVNFKLKDSDPFNTNVREWFDLDLVWGKDTKHKSKEPSHDEGRGKVGARDNNRGRDKTRDQPIPSLLSIGVGEPPMSNSGRNEFRNKSNRGRDGGRDQNMSNFGRNEVRNQPNRGHIGSRDQPNHSRGAPNQSMSNRGQPENRGRGSKRMAQDYLAPDHSPGDWTLGTSSLGNNALLGFDNVGINSILQLGSLLAMQPKPVNKNRSLYRRI